MKPWTDQHDQALIDGICAGRTMAEIGTTISRSRNSCAGRAWRLGMSSPKRPQMSRVEKKREPKIPKLPQVLRTPGPKRNTSIRANFAEAIANIGTISGASASLGLSRQRGGQLFAQIRHELGWQAQ